MMGTLDDIFARVSEEHVGVTVEELIGLARAELTRLPDHEQLAVLLGESPISLSTTRLT